MGAAEAAKCLTLEHCWTIGRNSLVAAVSYPVAVSQVFAGGEGYVLW